MNTGFRTFNYFSVLTDLCENCDNEQGLCSCSNNYLQTPGNENRNLHLHDKNIYITNPSTNLHVQTNNIRSHNTSSLSAQNVNDNISHASLMSSVSGDNDSITIQSSNSFRYNMQSNSCTFVSDSCSISNNERSTKIQSKSSISDSSSVSNNSCNTLNLGLRGKGMRIGHLNIQGLCGKIDQVRLMLTSENNLVHIFGISESKLKDMHPENVFFIDGYQTPIRKDRIEGGGGIIVYIKENIIYKRRNDLESNDLESVWIEVCPTNGKSFLVCYIYRHPSSTVMWNEHFENCLDLVLAEEKEFFMLGDFNRDLLNNTIKRNWLDFIAPFGLSQMVDQATRITSRSATLIDHIYCNIEENCSNICVPKLGLSDHFPVFVTRKINLHVPKSHHYTISYRCFKTFNEENFIKDLRNVPWDTIKIFDDPNDVLDAWNDLFIDVVDQHIPIKKHRVKHKTQPQWLTPEIIDSIKTRDRFKAIGDEDQFKIWRNKVTSLIRKSKKSRYEALLEENTNPNCIWKLFKEVGASKKCKTKSNVQIKINDVLSENSEEVSNAFNNFFVQVADSIKEPILPSKHEKLQAFCRSKNPNNVNFNIPCLELNKVEKTLKSLDITKATGTDNIGPRLLKIAASEIAESITFICNCSIQNSLFPDRWKDAKVSPLHKNGPCDDVNNYRPISVLPVLSKILEKHVHLSLMSYLNEHDFLHPTQSGFRSAHSCETALVNMIDRWLQCLDNGQLVGVVLVDFKKAFDLVDHNILLQKLKLYNLSEKALNWFSSYLMSRTQRVSINNVLSEHRSILHGVPQGSILGPLLFLMFINDLPLYTNGVSTDMYADDTTLFDISTSKEAVQTNLQKALLNLDVWCRHNGMVINSSKTKVMLITTSQKRSKLDNDTLQLKYKDVTLHMVSYDKILGVYVDNNLTWSYHINFVTKKVSSYLWLLSRIKEYLTIENRVKFYKSYIQPHLDFCNIIWGNTSQGNLLKIYRLQKRACRIILNYEIEDMVSSLNTIKILTIYERIFLRKAKFMFKVFIQEAPLYIRNMFEPTVLNNDARVLRSSSNNNFVIPKPNKELFKFSMSYSGTLIWNILPEYIKMSNNVLTFHNRCIKWMKCQ
ncbi:MAG: reverse transcriptase domain-containing protein [Candidatus Thiodiazotropha taylori]|nr:hypothetical protein [Candidatus Thiodiazotropha taylori]MCW4285780.1 reverse transcriptase domain-containing protein [Candidatus Thiodiazotropha taylori]